MFLLFVTLITSLSLAKDSTPICAVDMGSNTFKFIIGEIKNRKYSQTLELRNDSHVGDDLKNSKEKTGKLVISEAKLQEIKNIMGEYQKKCEEKTGIKLVHAVATAAFRQAENSKHIEDEIKKGGVDIKIISGEEESAYAYEAATLGENNFAVLDMGSRSTELVSKGKAQNFSFKEIDTGYKTAFDDYYKNAKTFSEGSKKHRERLRQLLVTKDFKILKNKKEFIAVEAAEVAAYLHGGSRDSVDGMSLRHTDLKKKIKELEKSKPDDFEKVKATADAAKILPRLVLLEYILSKSGYQSALVSTHDLNVAVISRLTAGKPL
jgi:exopolyphosphatase/pppGpp-phosphohydrolase